MPALEMIEATRHGQRDRNGADGVASFTTRVRGSAA